MLCGRASLAGWLRDEISDVNMGTGVSGQNEARRRCLGDVGGQAGWSEARRDDANRTRTSKSSG